MYRKFFSCAALFCAALLAVLPALPALFPSPAAAAAEGMVIRNGMARQIVEYTCPLDERYSNRNSEILRFAVYVETDYDTDLDGKPDLIKTFVQLPRPAAEGVYRAPVIYEARPYIAGMYLYNPELPAAGETDFDLNSLYGMPEKRVPSGKTTALALADAARPGDWYYRFRDDTLGMEYVGNFTTYDDLLVCGFAVVQSAGPGTFGSEGFCLCGSDLEQAAFTCVVEWLTGKRNAYTDLTGTTAVSADWCSGRIGMTGRSYAGAMAFGVASTGVEGLETIVPVAGVASWYEYGNSQGGHTGQILTWDALADLSMTCASRFFVPGEEEAQSLYNRALAAVRDAQIGLEGDYGPFWETRDVSRRDGFRASALIVQGLNDVAVYPKNFDLMRRALLRCGCETKVLLHRNGHVTPANEQTQTDIMIGDHTYTEWLNLWFTHTLLGVENEAAALPALTVQSNVDGLFFGTEEWDTGNTLRMKPNDKKKHKVSAKDAFSANQALLDSFTGKSGKNRLVWTMDAKEEITVNGPAEVHLRISAENPDAKILTVGAVLVDYCRKPFPCYDTGYIGVLDQEILEENGVNRGAYVPAYSLARWKPRDRNRSVIAFGSMDLRNPEAGYEPRTAVRTDTPVGPGIWYDYTLYLQPGYYTVQKGHRLELYIVPFCGGSTEYPWAEGRTEETLREYGLDPAGVAPVTRNYAFTVDNAASWADLPVVRK